MSIRRKYLYRYLALPTKLGMIRKLRAAIMYNLHFTTPAETLNDPFDCRAGYDTRGVTVDDVASFLRQPVKHPDGSTVPAEKIESAIEKLRQYPEHVTRQVKAVNDHSLAAISDIYLLCFSESPKNLLMWSHYADAHRGICLQFDTSLLALDGQPLFPVRYSHPLPHFRRLANSLSSLGLVEALITTKSVAWEYEKEWRIVLKSKNPKESLERRPLQFPPNTLTGILFGCRISPQYRERIEKWASASPVNQKIVCYQCKKDEYSFRLRTIRCPPSTGLA